MSNVGSVGGNAAVEQSLVRAAETDTEKGVALLKKALDSDKQMVDKLLPPTGGMLDIKA